MIKRLAADRESLESGPSYFVSIHIVCAEIHKGVSVESLKSIQTKVKGSRRFRTRFMKRVSELDVDVKRVSELDGDRY